MAAQQHGDTLQRLLHGTTVLQSPEQDPRLSGTETHTHCQTRLYAHTSTKQHVFNKNMQNIHFKTGHFNQRGYAVNSVAKVEMTFYENINIEVRKKQNYIHRTNTQPTQFTYKGDKR